MGKADSKVRSTNRLLDPHNLWRTGAVLVISTSIIFATVSLTPLQEMAAIVPSIAFIAIALATFAPYGRRTYPLPLLVAFPILSALFAAWAGLTFSAPTSVGGALALATAYGLLGLEIGLLTRKERQALSAAPVRCAVCQTPISMQSFRPYNDSDTARCRECRRKMRATLWRSTVSLLKQFFQ